jgi:hypothetical protein
LLYGVLQAEITLVAEPILGKAKGREVFMKELAY